MQIDYRSRLTALRAALHRLSLDGLLVPRADEHLGEYIHPSAERLAFCSGFTGSAGLAIIFQHRAIVFSDSRYTLQLAMETDPSLWERLDMTEQPPELWLKTEACGKRIGYDPWLVSDAFLQSIEGIEMIPLAANPVDEIWRDRPAASLTPAVAHDLRYAGETTISKRARIATSLCEAGQDAAVLTDPASLAWLFNLRGSDLAYTPVASGFAILHRDASAQIFFSPNKLGSEVSEHLGGSVIVETRDALEPALSALSGKTVLYDPAAMPVWFKNTLLSAGAKIDTGEDPVALPRACKNPVEQQGARIAHLRDAIAMVRFLAWLADAAPKGRETEISAGDKLLAFRSQGENFRGESFAAITGAGEHGAIVHYRVSSETNRVIKPNEIFLIDSGGQYLDGTTDITRTVWTGPGPAPETFRDQVTRVLIGHIELARVVFPHGVAGTHLDVLARTALWRAGLDYDQGTGHGVGAYLSVHEGPARIKRNAAPVPLQPGMILSNEPGFYLPGAYGIRLENLLLVQPTEIGEQGRRFLKFEVLTKVPFDRSLIDARMLSGELLDWLNGYHESIWVHVAPLLTGRHDAMALDWLARATAPM